MNAREVDFWEYHWVWFDIKRLKQKLNKKKTEYAKN